MSRMLLEGGNILDGTGAPAFEGSVRIEDGRIAAVGRLEPPPDARRMDCRGLVVAPGFIDAHSHSDLQVLEERPEKLRQGVTTEVVGNCGFSAFPAAPDRGPLREFANGIFCGGDDWGWDSAQAYLEAAARARHVNVFPLVGHGTLRIAQAGLRQGPLAEKDVEAMEGILAECLQQGAAGFSTGLMYAPGSSAPFEELERLCRVVARHGKVYATHMRSYFSGILEAIREQLELARRSGCRLQISHLHCSGRRNWELQPRALEMIEQARAEGIDVAFDCYPYVAGSTVLTQILPQEALEGGTARLLARLADAAERRRIAEQTAARLEWGWDDIFISAVRSEANRPVVGKNLATIAAERGRAPVEVALDLLVEDSGAVNMLCFSQSEENLRQTLTHPLSLIISDGFYVKGRPHPRLFGTFPCMLGEFARDRGYLPLAEAVSKMTDQPARRFGMRGLGRIAEGYRADITVFDAARIGSAASYEHPEAAPSGVHAVLRGGEVVWRAEGG